MADQLFPGFNLLNPVTYVPVFGNWCGPSWSAGQRTSGVLTAEQLLVGGLTVTGADGIRRQSLVDLACKAHDIEYSAAEGKPNQALLTLQADLTLAQSVSTLNWNQLNSNEKVYAGAMTAAFIAKLASVDVLGLFVDGTSALRAAAVTAMQQILNLAAPFGNQYGDGAGNTISWAKDSNGLISIASTQATQTETFKLDAAGNRTFDFKNSNYEEIQVANSVASINANILGRGDIISISNANITLGDASSATITGSANKITTGNVGRVVVNGNGNNLSGSQGHIEFGDGSSGNIVNETGTCSIFGANSTFSIASPSSYNNTFDIFGNNNFLSAASGVNITFNAGFENTLATSYSNVSFLGDSGSSLTVLGSGDHIGMFGGGTLNANLDRIAIYGYGDGLGERINGSNNYFVSEGFGGEHVTIVGQNNIGYLYGDLLTYAGSTQGDGIAVGSGSIFNLPGFDFYNPDPISPQGHDPIILNLTGGKVQTVALSSSSAYFDVQNNGNRIHTAWGTIGEGYLVYDPANKNVIVNNASLVADFHELFGFDSNHDNKLSALDAAWSLLKVWVDQYGNGNFLSGSLQTLDQIGIASISLSSSHVMQNSNNNTILDDSTFTWASGSLGDISAVSLTYDPNTLKPVSSGGGGGGRGGCVQHASLLPGGRTAGEMVIGSEMVLAHELTLKPGTGAVRLSRRRTFPGFRITTESGVTLVCSETAPIPTQNGLVRPPALLGLQVAVRRDEGGSFMAGWESVVRVEPVGAIEVQQIDVGDRCFWAGECANAFILHHNIGSNKMYP